MVQQQAVIYCRVSSQAQLRKGDGLGSQETRCREYARHKNYEVSEVFLEEGVTGKIFDRPKMLEMLSYLSKHKKKHQHVVIIDDISRLARDIETHIRLRTEISSAGGKLESPSIEFGEDSDSRLVEHLLASVAAHQREKNAEQVKNRMKARIQNGYWVFPAPIGYKYERKSSHGKILVPDEPVANIVKQALEGFAVGRFDTQTEVQRFLLSHDAFPKDRNGEVHFQRVPEMLQRLIYTGYFEYPEWGIPLMRGKHEIIIDYETHKRILERLKVQAKAPARKDIHKDFPLRGFVLCDCCGKPMTASWSQGKYNKFPYYLCRNKACDYNRKTIRKETMEDEFEAIIAHMRPSSDTLQLARKLMRESWNRALEFEHINQGSVEDQIRQTERKIDQLIDRITETDSTTLMGAYEAKLKKLEIDKVMLQEKIAKCGTTLPDFENTFQTLEGFLCDPQKMWGYDDIVDQKTALKLLFSEPVRYRRKVGFQTPRKAQIFGLFEAIETGNSEMVVYVGGVF